MYVMYRSQRIDYHVVESNRKTVSLFVDPREGVIVKAPQKVDISQIREIIMKKAPWILEKLKGVEEMVRVPPEKEFVSGESFPYLGRNYRLKIEKEGSKSGMSLVGGRFVISVNPSLDYEKQVKIVRTALTKWYKEHAEVRLTERVDMYASKVDTYPSKIVVKNQAKRWGSCTKNGSVNFNWKIVMAPMSVVDYVVVHELCHLRESSHSSRFWILLRSALPDYEKRRDWLRINGRRLSF
ncbi:MAG: SprT family zinc-dependent metalloprotease [Candidatus Methanofastidiosia archaeon]